MGFQVDDNCAVVYSPPIPAISSPDFVGKTIADLRMELKEKLELSDGAPAMVSKNRGRSYVRVDDRYIVEKKDVVQFGRASSSKGGLI